MLNGLQLGECSSEGFTLLHIVASFLEDELTSSRAQVGDEESLLRKLLHQLVESFVDSTFAAENRRAGNAAVFEKQLRSVLQSK